MTRNNHSQGRHAGIHGSGQRVGSWLDWKLSPAREFGMAEWMDEPDADPALLDDSLRFLTSLNRRLGWTRAMIDAVDCLAREVRRPVTILDVGTGAGDLPAAIAKDRRLAGSRIVGIDLHARTVAYARQQASGRYEVLQGDALSLPFADGGVDICTCGLFLHHLPSDLVVKALAEMRRVSRVGLVAGDLLRSRRGLLGIRLLGLVSNAMVRHDGEVSVRQAFTVQEIRALLEAGGWRDVSIRTMSGIRLLASARV